jgi:hypothetical protein
MVKDQDDVVLALLSEIRAELDKHSAAFERIEARFDRIDARLSSMLRDMRATMREFA